MRVQVATVQICGSGNRLQTVDARSISTYLSLLVPKYRFYVHKYMEECSLPAGDDIEQYVAIVKSYFRSNPNGFVRINSLLLLNN